MKTIKILTAFILLTTGKISGQDCNNLVVDLEKGTLNDLSPKTSMADIKKKLPCFTAESPEGSSENCGGGVFYAKSNFFFYTGKDNINIRKGFTGKLSIELFDKTEKEATALLGKPEGDLADDEGVRYVFFKRKYGCIVLLIDEDKVREIFIYTIPADKVEICS